MPLILPWLSTETNPDPLRQIRDIPLARVIRDEVLASILRGDLSPGGRITEPEIAARLGVSRVPVREALRDLESTGLVESRKHSGVFVKQLSNKQVADLYQMRAMFDAYAGRLVAAMSDAKLVDALERHLENMDAAVAKHDLLRYYEANLHFHWDIIRACGNQQMCDVYRGIVQQLHLTRLKNLASDVGMLESIKEHHAIVDAIRAADVVACESLMANHVHAAGARFARLSPAGSGKSPSNAGSGKAITRTKKVFN